VTSTVDYRGDLSRRGRGRSWLWHARQPFVPPTKSLLRVFGMATVDHRPLPDFLLIGAKRGGSTSIYRNLLATPGVLGLFPRPADIKGTYFFDVEFGRGRRWYRSHFPTTQARRAAPDSDGRPAISGEASPYYLSHPHAARRAAALVPDAQIIVALRDPVDRAFSHYQERVRQGIETLPTFGAAIAAEDDRLRGEWERMVDDPSYLSAPHLNFGYVAQSRYDIGLESWLDAFGAARTLVLRSEDFYTDERAVLADVRAFLGCTPAELAEPVHFNRTEAGGPAPDLAEQLRLRLAPSVERLEGLVGRSFNW
jgi:hypothetical protein